MPWDLKKVDGGYKVHNKDTGKTSYSKKPQSKKKAMAQMKAMYANAHESRRKSRSLAEKLDSVIKTKGALKEWGGLPRGYDEWRTTDVRADDHDYGEQQWEEIRQRAADHFGVPVDIVSDDEVQQYYDEYENYEPDYDAIRDQQKDIRASGLDMCQIAKEFQPNQVLMAESLEAEAHYIAQEAHKTGDEALVKRLCQQAAEKFHVRPIDVYLLARMIYNRHFDRIQT